MVNNGEDQQRDCKLRTEREKLRLNFPSWVNCDPRRICFSVSVVLFRKQASVPVGQIKLVNSEVKTLKSEDEFAGAEYDPGKDASLILTM